MRWRLVIVWFDSKELAEVHRNFHFVDDCDHVENFERFWGYCNKLPAFLMRLRVMLAAVGEQNSCLWVKHREKWFLVRLTPMFCPVWHGGFEASSCWKMCVEYSECQNFCEHSECELMVASGYSRCSQSEGLTKAFVEIYISNWEQKINVHFLVCNHHLLHWYHATQRAGTD
jgi:hypothetical protein